MRSDDPVDVARLPGQMERTGAVVMNRRLFDVVDGPNGWGDDRGLGAAQAGTAGDREVVIMGGADMGCQASPPA